MTAEQQARDMLERMGVEGAQNFSAGDLVELANLIAERNHLATVVEFIGTAESGGELFPVGPADVEYAADGNTGLRYVGPWRFLDGQGDTFLAAVEDAMQKA
ncbi:MAG: hypothetical protein HUU30_17630 [Burkholderiaceae bacterium]|nr:hypothetical protein [Aquabacterium sp.]NUP87555.1 hypothetical protein [Burkholderiaceae bacterium]